MINPKIWKRFEPAELNGFKTYTNSDYVILKNVCTGELMLTMRGVEEVQRFIEIEELIKFFILEEAFDAVSCWMSENHPTIKEWMIDNSNVNGCCAAVEFTDENDDAVVEYINF